MGVHRTLMTLLAVLVVASGCSSSGGNQAARSRSAAPSPAASKSAPPPSHAGSVPATEPPAPPLDWEPCGTFQCATLQVPLDYADPAGRHIGIALNRQPATAPARRIGSLLLNPGGPGASGIDSLPDLLGRLSSEVRARFDVVGFDPRGVGRSAPVRCLPDAELGAYLALDPTPDNAAEETALVGFTDHFVAGCQQRSGDLLAHVGTADAARDMDRIRTAVGDDKLTYVGFSYGTALGTAYAEQFPDRIRALLLDGALDPTLSTVALNRAQGEGFDHAFDAFAADCRATSSCSWRPAGGAGQAAFAALVARVEARPIDADSRRVGPSELLLGTAAYLYSRQTWTALARGLAQAQAGSGTILLAGFDALLGRKPDGSYSNDQEANAAISCLDRPAPRDVATYEQAAADAARTAPLFGPAIAWSGLVCARWPVPATGKAEPAKAPGSPPILVVGTTNDPATPFVWAEALARQLPQGRLLTHQGEGHTAYGEDPCTSRIGDAYLLTLQLPAGQLRC